jgi:hypothetical protein
VFRSLAIRRRYKCYHQIATQGDYAPAHQLTGAIR